MNLDTDIYAFCEEDQENRVPNNGIGENEERARRETHSVEPSAADSGEEKPIRFNEELYCPHGMTFK